MTVDRHNAKHRMRSSNEDISRKYLHHFRNERSHIDDGLRRSHLRQEETLPWDNSSYDSGGKGDFDISGEHREFLNGLDSAGIIGEKDGFEYTERQGASSDEYRNMSSKEREVENDLIALDHEIGIVAANVN